MYFKQLPYIYGVGVFLLVVGVTFRITHWPWGSQLSLGGKVVMSLYFARALQELFSRQNTISLLERFGWIGVLTCIWVSEIPLVKLYFNINNRDWYHIVLYGAFKLLIFGNYLVFRRKIIRMAEEKETFDFDFMNDADDNDRQTDN